MNQDYLEAVVVLRPQADKEKTASWFRRHGVEVTLMRAGMLLSGSLALFERVLQVDLTEVEKPDRGDLRLPTPDALKDQISSIVARRPPAIHPQR